MRSGYLGKFVAAHASLQGKIKLFLAVSAAGITTSALALNEEHFTCPKKDPKYYFSAYGAYQMKVSSWELHFAEKSDDPREKIKGQLQVVTTSSTGWNYEITQPAETDGRTRRKFIFHADAIMGNPENTRLEIFEIDSQGKTIGKTVKMDCSYDYDI